MQTESMTRRSELWRIVIVLAALSPLALFAAVPDGTVTDVSGSDATIQVSSSARPTAGDRVEIFFKLAGSDEEVSVATGRVMSVANQSVKVKIEDATGEVQRNQFARFKPGNGDQPAAPSPPPVSTETPAASPTNTLPPSIPFPSASPKSSAPPPVTQIDPAATQLVNRGITQYSAGDIAGAIASYTEAIRIAPKLAVAYLNRANAYLYKPDFRAAIADANKALELKVDKTEDAYVIRGAAQAGLGQYDAAIADCNRALKINPNNALAYNNRANDKLRKGDYKGALADCNKSIALNPNFALPYYNRGYAYYNMGNFAGALADWKKAVQMQPSFGAELNPRISQIEAQAPRKSR